MTDSKPALDTPIAPESDAGYRILVWSAALGVVVGFLLPWLDNGSHWLSGAGLAVGGLWGMWLIPGSALAAVAILVWRPHWRPMIMQLCAVTAALVITTVIAIALNYEETPLALIVREGQPSVLRFLRDPQPILFTSLFHVGFGMIVVLFGLIALFFAPALRGRAAALGPANSLEALAPVWERQRECASSAMVFLSATILIVTYAWCGISPMTVWENRGNAREYLFGRDLNQADRDYIDDQARRAPEIEAQGRARAFQDNKYRGMPFDQQPTLEEKFKENELLVERFLAEMTPEEKEVMVETARHNARDEKRGGYFPPETAWPRVQGYLIALLETVAIAIWGTMLAIVCAVPAALLAAQNTVRLIIPGAGPVAASMRAASVFGMRRLLDACRGFNEFVMALIFVAVIGLGPYAGILALWIHTFGILGKVFSEQIEAIDGGQVEALTSTGAAVDQTIAFSVLPQVMPGFVSYSLLRFESNVRSAAILGFVGAGGIGFLIFDKLNGYLFREVCTMMIIIIVTVGIIDHLCGRLRRRFI